MKINFGCSFHDDKFFLEIVSKILPKADYFIETGSWEGDSTGFVTDNYPNIKCFTCEPDAHRFGLTQNKLKSYPQVTVYNMQSPEVFDVIAKQEANIFDKHTVFWLDAHGWGFKWPLKDEIKYITSNFKNAYIFIDDFKNPFVPEMQYHQYDGQYCTWEYIKDDIVDPQNFEVWYPTYNQLTSRCNGLVGWVLITNVRNQEFTGQIKRHI